MNYSRVALIYEISLKNVLLPTMFSPRRVLRKVCQTKYWYFQIIKYNNYGYSTEYFDIFHINH